MHEPHEDSYYEVALSHRQVVWVFVVLLGCVVAAFLAGVWIGQQQEGAARTLAVAAAQEPAERGGRELEELNFFNDEGTPPRPAVADPEPGRTLADDLGGSPRPSPAPPPAAEEPPIAEPPVVAVAPPAAPAAAPSTGGLVIQVFSAPDRTQAESVIERLRGGGHPAFLSPVEVDGKTMFRVRIGPFDERAGAERVADEVRRTFQLDTWITQNS